MQVPNQRIDFARNRRDHAVEDHSDEGAVRLFDQRGEAREDPGRGDVGREEVFAFCVEEGRGHGFYWR